MNKLKYIKLEQPDGSYSVAIPLAVDSNYVDVNGNTLTNELNNKATKAEVQALASGSPKGAYETTTALIAANPATGVYIVTENGHIYSWTKNASNAIDLGLYQSTSLSEENVIIYNLNNEIRDALNYKNIGEFSEGHLEADLSWIRYPGDVVDITSPYSIRATSRRYISVKAGDIIELKDNNLKWSFSSYDSISGACITGTNKWITGSYIFSEDVTIAIQVAKKNNLSFTQDEIKLISNNFVFKPFKENYFLRDITKNDCQMNELSGIVAYNNVLYDSATNNAQYQHDYIVPKTPYDFIVWNAVSMGEDYNTNTWIIIAENDNYYLACAYHGNQGASSRMTLFTKDENHSEQHLPETSAYTSPFYNARLSWGGTSWAPKDKIVTYFKQNTIYIYNSDVKRQVDMYSQDLTSIFIEYQLIPCLGLVLGRNSGRQINTFQIYTKISTEADDQFDLFMFMGQSNMAGRGIVNSQHPEGAPKVLWNKGYEYRSISKPDSLSLIKEPFGVNENKTGGISESSKTGSMVSSFVNAYYNVTNIPIIAVSASQGGTTISQWQPDGILLTDAVQRLDDTIAFCNENGISIRHKYMVWCQGESDGDANTSKENYITGFNNMFNLMQEHGIEKCFIVRIGNCNISGSYDRYSNVIQWQNEISSDYKNKDLIMVSTNFASMRERGMMKDQFHYYQDGYNEVGNQAGTNTGLYVTTSKEPLMYDSESENKIYASKKM